jgi:hypothetical protein
MNEKVEFKGLESSAFLAVKFHIGDVRQSFVISEDRGVIN